MAINKPLLTEKVHYSGPSSGGGGGYHPHGGGGGGGGGYGYGGGHVYSSIGHSGYGSYGQDSHSSKGSGKKSVALSALTLLAFLFFLHILQTCLQDQTATNSTTTTFVVMAGGRKENREKPDVISKRKGDVDHMEHGDYAEKKSPQWEELGTVTTRVKTFSKSEKRDGL